MNIETVNELIASLESAGELSIKETKVMALAKAFKQLAAENVGLKAAFNKPDAWLSCHSIPPTYQEPDRGGEYLAVHEQPGEKNDDGSDSWPVYAKPEIETPATDRIVAGIKADGVEEFVSNTVHKIFDGSEAVSALAYLSMANSHVNQLRDGGNGE
ncbi:TPA: hypothetical protein NPW46_005090 [Klebsiella pneumoniae]|nr:hypothetical protein [Klebsiella pneumoniae]